MHHIIRAYDIRGHFGRTLTLEKIEKMTKHLAYALPNSNATVLVGYDGRTHSPLIAKSVIQTLVDEGIHVIDVGLVPTPVIWYGLQILDVDMGIMITASHNPPQDNGLKVARKDKPLVGDDFWTALQTPPQKRNQKGCLEKQDLLSSYINHIFCSLPKPLDSTLSIVWDTAHGAAGPCVKMLNIGTILHEEIDGTFPAHEPDPTKEKNMKILKDHVLKSKADIGIGLDGDGDRLGVMDKNGRLIPTELLMCLWIEDILKRHPASTIVVDIKTSNFVKETVENLGGQFILCRTGHSYIKQKMKETGALFGGEASGHIFFADCYGGFDDAIYASLRLLSLNPDLTKLHNPYQMYDEQIPCSDEKKFDVITQLQETLRKHNIPFNDLDGVRVDQPDGWWLVRASNTQPLLTVRCESKTSLDHLRKNMKQWIQEIYNSNAKP